MENIFDLILFTDIELIEAIAEINYLVKNPPSYLILKSLVLGEVWFLKLEESKMKSLHVQNYNWTLESVPLLGEYMAYLTIKL